MQDELERIQRALEAARSALLRYTPGDVGSRSKTGGDPVTEADHEVNAVLHDLLPREGEGWLSEETADSERRLRLERVWVVDPLDGTREFIDGIPEWCVSVGLVEHGHAVAGGILNPQAEQLMVGAVGHGVSLNGRPVSHAHRDSPAEAVVLASRSEIRRGEWKRFESAPFEIRPMGSVAYKMGCVAGGLADATWTLVPKNEWDVAAGTALVLAAGGSVQTLDGSVPTFNRRRTLFNGLLAFSPGCQSWAKAFARDLVEENT